MCFFKYKIPLSYRTIKICLSKQSGMEGFQTTKVAKFLFLPNVLILSEIEVNELSPFTDMQRLFLSDIKTTTKDIIQRWLWRLVSMMEVSH